MLGLKVQFKVGKDVFSISQVDDKVTYWVLTANKKLGRQVASKVVDPAQLKKLQSVYGKIQKAVA